MGRQLTVQGRVNGDEVAGVAQLEAIDVRFRPDGGRRWLKVPFNTATALSVQPPWLRITHPGGQLDLALGGEAATWAERIRSPKTLLDKLGITATTRLAVIGEIDPEFWRQLEQAGVTPVALGSDGADVIVTAIDDLGDIDSLPTLERGLRPKGAIWLVHRKGAGAIPDADLRSGWKRHDLVDTKISSFSATHTATQLRRRRP